MGTWGDDWGPRRPEGKVGMSRSLGHAESQEGALPQEPPTLRLALARAHFLQEEASGSPCSAHDAVIIVSNPVVPTHGCPTGRAALWSQEHLWLPRAWVHTAGTAQVTEGALAGVWGQEDGGQGTASCVHTLREVGLHTQGSAHRKDRRTS